MPTLPSQQELLNCCFTIMAVEGDGNATFHYSDFKKYCVFVGHNNTEHNILTFATLQANNTRTLKLRRCLLLKGSGMHSVKL